MTDSQKIFDPRPEAQATTWDVLMPPVKMAVHDLLVRIYGAHHSVREKNTGKSADSSVQQTGNCFLVYGSRGTGKTTVLLNAQRAVCQKTGKTFFTESPNETKEQKEAREAKETASEKKAREAEENARNNAKKLRKDGIVWLEILNLEPIPSEANLLTVLLTQVRNALHSHCDKRQRDQRSIFEEEANSAQQQLNRLIGETTLMWQNISEPDTRNISARQVKAADIYAGFQEKFKKAMDKLIEELSDTRSSDSRVSIVLPIDNIDRSTEHLQSIVKLAQLVSHPNLWLVMAGDRVEVETFLERGYWKELIRSSDGAGARGKIDSDGEDEALVMARRQANATAQKLWPANHRVEIDFLTPKETLAFEYKQNSAVNTSKKIKELLEVSVNLDNDEETLKVAYECNKYFTGNGKDDKSIRGMLANVQIPTTEQERESNYSETSTIKLLNLFDATNQCCHLNVPKEDEPLFTRAAQYGLLLPARSVLELWQLLDWLKDDVPSNDFRAEKIARTMLRNAISCSAMPNAMAQNLQNDILRRGEKGGTVIDFTNNKLAADLLTTPNHNFEYALTFVVLNNYSHYANYSDNWNYKLRSQLVVRNIEDVILSLRNNYQPIINDVAKQNSKHFLIENVNERRGGYELPPLVAAWIMVLYDILIFAEDEANSWVTKEIIDLKWGNVIVNHSIVHCNAKTGKLEKTKYELSWSAPYWGLFLGRNTLRLRWHYFQRTIKGFSRDPKDITQEKQQKWISRLLAAGWIFCVLTTFFELIKIVNPENKQKYDMIDTLEIKYPEREFSKKGEVMEFEKSVIKIANEVYTKIKKEKTLTTSNSNTIAYIERINATAQWMEEKLIYFLSYVYVPLPEEKNTSSRLNELWGYLEDDCELKKYWRKNKWFILATLDRKLAEAKGENHIREQAHTRSEYIKSLGALAELHNFHW